MKLFSLFALSSTQGQLLSREACPEIPKIADFDAERYSGQWWEQARYPYAFQNPLGRCVGAKYGVIDESKISVLNTNVIPKPDGSGLWEMQYVNAFGTIVDPEFPNKLNINFDYFGPNVRERGTNYWVMETDYDEYTIVMNCEGRDDGFTVSYGWLMTREKDMRVLNPRRYDELLEKAKGYSTLWARPEVITADNTDCSFDEESYWPN